MKPNTVHVGGVKSDETQHQWKELGYVFTPPNLLIYFERGEYRKLNQT